MSFVSQIFWLFTVVLFVLYWYAPRRYRWVLMLCASYLFYGYWDWRYLPLLVTLTAVNYSAVLLFATIPDRSRRTVFLAAITANLGALFYFKYWNFFRENAGLVLERHVEFSEIVLPLGISFYVFQSLSYLIDGYLNRIRAERNFGYFALFVAFFPQLVAGPIERSQTLLPQLKALRRPGDAEFSRGVLLIVWGLFLKLVIADNLTGIVNGIYFNEGGLAGYLYWLAGVLVSFKIYCDFLAYSEIARGLASLFGVKLTRNFRRPFLARDLHDFWQRWHISLTKWIGMYVQLPLVRLIEKPSNRWIATVSTMILIGLWHGASWNFVGFGLYHGVLLAMWVPVSRSLMRLHEFRPLTRNVANRGALALILASGSTLFYIADSDRLAFILGRMVDMTSFLQAVDIAALPGKFEFTRAAVGLLLLTAVSLFSEWTRKDLVEMLVTVSPPARLLVLVALITMTLMLGNFDVEDFVYFEF